MIASHGNLAERVCNPPQEKWFVDWMDGDQATRQPPTVVNISLQLDGRDLRCAAREEVTAASAT